MPTMIQIRNVPDGLHRKLKARAALAGKSLSEYLLGEIREVAEPPTIEEPMARLKSRPPSPCPSILPTSSGKSATFDDRGPMIVLDASIVVEFRLRTPQSEAIERRLFREGETLHAPHLPDIEVVQILRRLTTRGQIDADRGRDAIADLIDLPIQRYPHDWLLASAWTRRENVTAYDAMYAGLTDALDAPLLTRDRPLASAVGRMIAVEVF